MMISTVQAAMSRRRFLGLAGTALGTTLAVDLAARVIDRATQADSAGIGSLSDVDHFVLLMQENRSFDHYFGSLSGVDGFDDRSSVFRQVGSSPAGPLDVRPFHLDTRARPELDADIIDDPAHDWGVQHRSWNDGAMDGWLTAHGEHDGVNTPMIMGYYTRADLPVHYALADAFTVCDHYFCSVLGPTAPNRLYWMTGTLDPDGRAGGPVIENIAPGRRRELSWTTFPEVLEDAGVSWKIYNAPRSQATLVNGMVQHFRAYRPGTGVFEKGIVPSYPTDFVRDVERGTLPHVSWIIPAMQRSEHPSFPAAVGADEIVDVLALLTSRPALWERTALIVSYDENGGLFDHVPPPTPPTGTSAEFVSRPAGPEPVGLGFRVPCLVLSPYARGGFVSSEVYDHTSQLQLLAARFGVSVPNLSNWRAGVAGDMRGIFRPRSSAAAPRFPLADREARRAVAGDQTLIASASHGHRPPYPIPRTPMARQERTPVRRRLF